MDREESESRAVMLSPVLDLNAAAPLREQLLALRGGAVTLDGSAVERLGALCLQVLLAARKTWRDDGAEFRLTGASDALAEQLAAFGASDLQSTPAGAQA